MAALRDIAKIAGVSISTVSRALVEHPKISKETKLRIKKIAFDLNYKMPNQMAQINNKLIGIIVPNCSTIFFAEIIKGVEEVLKNSGYVLILGNSNGDEYEEKKLIKKFKDHGIAGLIIFVSNKNIYMLEEMEQEGIRVVIIGSQIKGFNVVDTNNQMGMFLATKHLIDLGHKEIAFLSAKIESYSRIARLDGYKEALVQGNIPYNEELVIIGGGTYEHGYEGTLRLFERSNPPTGLITQSDVVTMGVLAALDELQKEVPRDVAVVSFDDTMLARIVKPNITSIAQPKYEMGYIAGEALLKIIDNNGVQEKYKLVIQPKLVIRESTVHTIGHSNI